MDAHLTPGSSWGANMDRKVLKDHWKFMSPPMRIRLVFTIIVWAPVVVMMALFYYLFWHLPAKSLRRRSAMHRGRQATSALGRGIPEQRRRPTPAPPEVRLVVTGLDVNSKPIIERRRSTSITNISSLTVPFLHALSPQDHYLHRLVVVFLAFGPLFIILTISYEGLFYFSIAITLVSWVRLEHRIHQAFSATGPTISTTPPSSSSDNELTSPLAPALSAAQTRESSLHRENYRALTLADARICLFFLYLLQSAFFSTGNIASISSFSLDAVNRLIPVFDPFSQTALLILKILAPFALVSLNLGVLTRRLRLRGGSLFAVVMGIGDYLTLRFFWEVRDEGSWLEIGESISMFVIASGLCVFVAALEGLSEVFVRGVRFEDAPATASFAGTKREGNGVLNGEATKKGSGKSGKKAK